MKSKRTIWLISFFIIYSATYAFAQVTWTSIGPGAGSFLMAAAIQPDNSDVIYVGGDIEGVFKTTDGGASWTMMNNGLRGGDRPAGVYGIQELVIDPTDYQTLYACTWAGLFKSTDGAQNWTLIFPLPLTEEGTPVSYLAVDPDNGQVLYAGIGDADANDEGTGSLYRSTDGGSTWELLDVEMGDETVVHSLLIDSTSPQANRRIFVSTDKGVFRSQDNGATWTAVNTGLPHLNTRRLVAYTADGSLTLFLSIKTEGNPSDPSSFEGGIYKSTDSGDTWVSINGDLPALPYEDPSDPPPFYDYWKFVVHPTNPDILYTGTNLGGWDDKWGIYKTTDGGQHWIRLTGMPTDDVLSLTVDPSNSDVVYAGVTDNYDWSTGGGLYKSTDGGATWNDILDQPRVSAVVVHPEDSEVVFAASQPWWNHTPNLESGFYRSMDGGNTWELINGNLGHTFLLTARINPHNPTQILVGTHGGGVWIGDGVLRKKNNPTPAHFSLHQNYPNPLNQETTIEYSLAESCQVTLKIYNLSGQLIKTLINEYQQAGSHKITWYGDNEAGQEVARGVYFYQIKAGDFVSTKKMAVSK